MFAISTSDFMKPVTEIYEEVKANIARAAAKSGRSPDEIKVVAVTKTHGPDVVAEALDAGLEIIGENKVQEAAWKKPLSPSGQEWHMIGHLQTNKVRQAMEIFDCFHSVDSLKLIDRMDRVAGEIFKSPRILLEVNVSGEKSKTGMSIDEIPRAIERVMSSKSFWLEGLMTMAPFSENSEDSRPYFNKLRQLRDEMSEKFNIPLKELSMGMSGDYLVAVEEGATFVRLGTVLFGDRPKLKRTVSSDDDTGGFSSALDSYSGEGPTFKILD